MHGSPAPPEDAGAEREAARLAEHGVLRIRAENPGPLTLSGTNTWVVGEQPGYVIDPGPALPEHVDRVVAAVTARGGLGAIVLTHDHADHTEAVDALRARLPAPLASAAGAPDIRLTDGLRVGPLEAIATPGHASDHMALIAGRACFTGDAVLGEGSVFIGPAPGALDGYLRALERLRERDLEVLCPGHGPPIWDPPAKLEGYIAHRLDRERRLLDALERGLRSEADLLDAAWSDVPDQLRPVAAITLAAHLERLSRQGRLPDDVPRGG